MKKKSYVFNYIKIKIMCSPKDTTKSLIRQTSYFSYLPIHTSHPKTSLGKREYTYFFILCGLTGFSWHLLLFYMVQLRLLRQFDLVGSPAGIEASQIGCLSFRISPHLASHHTWPNLFIVWQLVSSRKLREDKFQCSSVYQTSA